MGLTRKRKGGKNFNQKGKRGAFSARAKEGREFPYWGGFLGERND